MDRNGVQTDDLGKTGVLVAVGNMLLAPLYWADTKLGLTATIAGTAALLYGAHEVGKKRRPIENAANNVNSFFGSKTGDKSTEVENLIANIVVGGGAIFDEILPDSTHPKH